MTQLADDVDYPLLNVFWTMLWLFLWILWFFLLVRTITDVFRSRDLSGLAKATWTVCLIVVPFLTVFIYLIFRGSSMHTRDAQGIAASDEAAKTYIRSVAGTSASAADEVGKLASLRDRGVLTEQEFTDQKAKLLHA